MARGELTDVQFQKLEPLLPKKTGKRGHPWREHRQVINGILWILRTGAPWEDLPPRYGPPSTCNDRLLRWKRDGTWQRILEALQSDADTDGALDWEEGSLDASIVKAHPHAAGAPRRRGGKKGERKQPLLRTGRRPKRKPRRSKRSNGRSMENLFLNKSKGLSKSGPLRNGKRSDAVEAV
jgi:transposase